MPHQAWATLVLAASVALVGCARTPPPSGTPSPPAGAAVTPQATSSAPAPNPPQPTSANVRDAGQGTVQGQVAPALSGALAFATARDGLAGSSGGGVIATADGGLSWDVRDAGGPQFQDLAFPAVGRAYGLTSTHVLWTSADGGHTWSEVRAFLVGTPVFSQGLDFTGPAAGVVAVGPTLYTTSDGGAHWASHAAPCAHGFSAGPVDAAHGDLLCAGQPGAGMQDKALYATRDGGTAWAEVTADVAPGAAPTTGLPTGGYAETLAFVTGTLGYLAEERGGLYRTDDGGRTFRPLLQSDGADGMAWPSAAIGFLETDGTVIATADGGTTWRQVYPALSPTGSIAFTSAARGVGLGTRWDAQAVLATTDGGGSWTAVGRVPTAATGLALQPSGTVWAYGAGLFRSTDGGRTWTAVTQIPPPGGGPLEGLAFPTETVGFTQDNQGQFFRTGDGGRTWSALPRSSVPGGASLAFATAEVGWAFGGALGEWETTDGGQTWRPSLGWSPPPRLGGFADAATGWAVAGGCGGMGACGGAVLRTLDGGAVWDRIAFAAPAGHDEPSFVGCTALDFPTAEVGYALLDGQLYRSVDGGMTWKPLDG